MADISVEVGTMKTMGHVAALACAASLLAAAQNTGVSGTRSNVLALEYAWDQAQEGGDTKALGEIFDNSLVFVDYDGRLLTKAEYLARVKSDASHLQQIVTESMSVQVFGETAIVVGIYRAKGVEDGKPYLRRRRFIDTWLLIGGHWMCVAAEATPILP
ncbi:MAG: nuclear transport factor 2 family protein [Candidatus Sulfotelmatobacter sp.]